MGRSDRIDLLTANKSYQNVSIQLVSPTSGEAIKYQRERLGPLIERFHSISFPNEWGDQRCEGRDTFYRVSIQLVSPTSGEQLASKLDAALRKQGFHSISFPNEWGEDFDEWIEDQKLALVSIQLVSPTSGEPVAVSSKQQYLELLFPFN